jgi:hypothetical protein
MKMIEYHNNTVRHDGNIGESQSDSGSWEDPDALWLWKSPPPPSAGACYHYYYGSGGVW